MSILIGQDSSGVLVHARDAIPGKVYTCPSCGVEMYSRRRPSDKDDATFVCAHSVRHGEKWCINLSGQQHRVYDLKRFDSDHFFKYILAAAPDNVIKTAPERTDETNMLSIFDEADAWDENSGEQTDAQTKLDNEVKVSRITSLKSMWDAGLYALDPRTHLGGKKLTDTLRVC